MNYCCFYPREYYLDTVYLYKVNYEKMAIQSFSEKETEKFFISGKFNKGTGWASVSNIVKRKLDMLHYATRLDDLKAPPGNKLEELKGNLEGFYSIRINERWRIIFRWKEGGPSHVRIIDYH